MDSHTSPFLLEEAVRRRACTLVAAFLFEFAQGAQDT
jgi:hypothetical protein